MTKIPRSAREILERCYWREHKNDITIDQALSELREMVEGLKKETDPDKIKGKDRIYIIASNLNHNQAIDDVLERLK